MIYTRSDMKMGRNWEAMILFNRARYAFFVSVCAR